MRNKTTSLNDEKQGFYLILSWFNKFSRNKVYKMYKSVYLEIHARIENDFEVRLLCNNQLMLRNTVFLN